VEIGAVKGKVSVGKQNEISQTYLHNFRLIFYIENLYVMLLDACKFHEN
jgi:hypothetical protein